MIVYTYDMKSMHYLLLVIAGLLASCGSPDYFLKEASKGDPHATLSLRNGSTQITKIDGKYPPEDAGATVRLKPGQHTLEVSAQGQQVGPLNGILGMPGREISSQAIMPADLAPGKFYRPDSSLNAAGTYFFLRDEAGMRSSITRSYTSGY